MHQDEKKKRIYALSGLGQQTSVSSGVAASVSRAKTEVKILNEQVKKGKEAKMKKGIHVIVVPCQGGKGSCQAGSQEGEEDGKEEGVG